MYKNQVFITTFICYINKVLIYILLYHLLAKNSDNLEEKVYILVNIKDLVFLFYHYLKNEKLFCLINQKYEKIYFSKFLYKNFRNLIEEHYQSHYFQYCFIYH